MVTRVLSKTGMILTQSAIDYLCDADNALFMVYEPRQYYKIWIDN